MCHSCDQHKIKLRSTVNQVAFSSIGNVLSKKEPKNPK